MVTADLEVKIIDFGTAKYINNQKSQTLSVVLKPGYAPRSSTVRLQSREHLRMFTHWHLPFIMY